MWWDIRARRWPAAPRTDDWTAATTVQRPLQPLSFAWGLSLAARSCGGCDPLLNSSPYFRKPKHNNLCVKKNREERDEQLILSCDCKNNLIKGVHIVPHPLLIFWTNKWASGHVYMTKSYDFLVHQKISPFSQILKYRLLWSGTLFTRYHSMKEWE